MSWMPVALLGLILEVGGIGYTACVLRNEWKKTARAGEHFEPQWLRRIFVRSQSVRVQAVAANMTIDAYASAYVSPNFQADDPIEDRLQQVEYWLQRVVKDSSEAELRLENKSRELKRQMESNAEETTQRFKQINEQLRHESILDLRRTGWGLIVAAGGLLLQVPAAVQAVL